MTVQWTEEYATGDPEIDAQHKQLFQYIADLEKHIADQDVSDKYLKRFLDFLGLYTRTHFCYEEICMRRRNCPVAAKNKEQHEKLVEAYQRFRARFDAEGANRELLEQLHNFLLSWLKNHILRIDTHLRNCKPA
ncbi:MAG: hemerythrin [Zetaproteobacteria bacterium]|nr:MAG: hemerythrin [Zetaproteobacteria bacterium]